MEQTKDSPAPLSYTMPLRVRYSDADQLGHVNNAVYLTYAMEAAFEHAASVGFTLERMRELGGVFVVRQTEIEYKRAARPGDDLLVTTTLSHMRGMRANRKTVIVEAAGGRVIATASSDYVWVNNHGRPAHVPEEAFDLFGLEKSSRSLPADATGSDS